MSSTPPLTPPETPCASDLRQGLPTARKPYHLSTLCVTVDNPNAKDQYGSSSVPIYQTTTFKETGGEYSYTRGGNPTRSHLEHHLAKISNARHAFAVSSGMTALDVITRLLKAGDEIIISDSTYGGTNRFLTNLKAHQGFTIHYADATRPESLHPLLKAGKTAMVVLESPSNPLLKITDLATICSDVRARAPDAMVVVDNSMMSPYLQRPLEHGADLVYDSATKYLSGHHDLMAGTIVCNRDDVAQKLAYRIKVAGNALSPFDSFLLLRGVKTLVIRMQRQQSTAMQVARYLSGLGFLVHYPGLEDHPGYELHKRLANGPGAVLSFVTGDKEMSERILEGTRLWGKTVSFGAVNSLISIACVIPTDPNAARPPPGLPENLIRLCVGIEDPKDLIDDLEVALLQAGAIKAGLVRTNPTYSPRAHGSVLNKAIEKLADRVGSARVEEEIPDTDWMVSAPGKVIRREHAVVHGATAVAAAVDRRCYAISSGRDDGKINLNLPDLDFNNAWNLRKAQPTAVPHLTRRVASGGNKPCMNVTARSSLPVGAGLGSSASYSSCIATILFLAHQRLKISSLPGSIKAPSSSDPVGHLHVSHAGRKALAKDFADEVNQWALVAEKVLHGNPSGVDNAVTVYGGALAFTKPGFAFANPNGGMDGIQGNTKSLVAGVALKKQQEPELVNGILERIQAISDEARRALLDPELERSEQLKALESLIDENHAHLVTLGVSHPALEKIRELTAERGLHAKLTGAGGDGCAVVLLPDTIDDKSLNELIQAPEKEGFEARTTSVGGSGLGILSPYVERSDEDTVVAEEDFVAKPAVELAQWAADRGRWLYT